MLYKVPYDKHSHKVVALQKVNKIAMYLRAYSYFSKESLKIR